MKMDTYNQHRVEGHVHAPLERLVDVFEVFLLERGRGAKLEERPGPGKRQVARPSQDAPTIHGLLHLVGRHSRSEFAALVCLVGLPH